MVTPSGSHHKQGPHSLPGNISTCPRGSLWQMIQAWVTMVIYHHPWMPIRFRSDWTSAHCVGSPTMAWEVLCPICVKSMASQCLRRKECRCISVAIPAVSGRTIVMTTCCTIWKPSIRLWRSNTGDLGCRPSGSWMGQASPSNWAGAHCRSANILRCCPFTTDATSSYKISEHVG